MDKKPPSSEDTASSQRNEHVERAQRVASHPSENSKKNHANKKHVCKMCLSSFASPIFLIRHIRSHTGEKPYKCEFCPKAFAERGKLNTHMRIHNNEKPFNCEICQSSFRHKSTIDKHMSTHTGVELLLCPLSDCFCKAR